MNLQRNLFATLLGAFALLVALPMAASTFTVSNSGSTFTITRSGEGTNAAETVRYRTVRAPRHKKLHHRQNFGIM